RRSASSRVSGGIPLSRETHHRFLLNDDATKGVALFSGAACVGYAYVSADGFIGPLAVARSADMESAFRSALALAAKTSASQRTAVIPSFSEPTLRLALEHGMRITIPMMLMSSRDFATWARYLPRNPGFM